jgi:aminoglycoside phosphotransferase (APT) family kinase protein
VIDDALLDVMSAHTGRQETFATRPTPISGGFWASIYGFQLADPPAGVSGPLVLRVMPDRDAGLRETIVQRAVADQGYPTPRVLLGGFDERLGGPFMVMERVDGAQLLEGLNIGRALLTLPKTLRRLAHQLSSATLQLHDLDPRPVSDAFDAAGVDIGSLGPEARLAEIRNAARSTGAGFDALLAWLEARRPVFTPVVVCHGDIHPFNMLVTEDGSFTMLDWTNGCLCRREYDVGCTAALLQCAPLQVPRIAQRSLGAFTGALARRFVATYLRSAPINLDVVEWFEILQYGRCLAAVVTAPIDDPIIGQAHPFRISAKAMARQVRIITDVTIDLPTSS